MSEKFTVGELVRSRNQATLDSLIPLREALEKYHKEGGYLSDVSYEDVIGKYPFLDGEPVYGLATPYPDLYYYNGRDLFPLIMFFCSKRIRERAKNLREWNRTDRGLLQCAKREKPRAI